MPDLPPWTDISRIHLCSNCHRVPQPGERHGLLDGTTEDGEPLGFTCLDADDQIMLPPTLEQETVCGTCGVHITWVPNTPAGRQWRPDHEGDWRDGAGSVGDLGIGGHRHAPPDPWTDPAAAAAAQPPPF